MAIMRIRNIIIRVHLLVFISACLGIASVFLAPVLQSRGLPFGSWIYALFSPICHQNPSRCFILHGFPLAVCARCLGIYIGFLGGTLAYPLRNGFTLKSLPSRITFLSVSLPIGLDTAGNFLSLWNSPDWLRLSLGIIWGGLLPFYVITGIADFFLHRKKEHSP